MKILPFETANAHLLKKDRVYYRDIDGNLAWDDDHMPLNQKVQPEDMEQRDAKDCFESCNALVHPVLRNFNGRGMLTHVSDSDLKQTSEQFAWADPKADDVTHTTRGGGAPVPFPDPKPRYTPAPKQKPKPKPSRRRRARK